MKTLFERITQWAAQGTKRSWSIDEFEGKLSVYVQDCGEFEAANIEPNITVKELQAVFEGLCVDLAARWPRVTP